MCLFVLVADLIADTVMARQGYPRIGISACFGGPLFSILLWKLKIKMIGSVTIKYSGNNDCLENSIYVKILYTGKKSKDVIPWKIYFLYVLKIRFWFTLFKPFSRT